MLDEGQQALAARSDYNFDHPDAFDFELLVSVLRKLKKGKSVKVPVYDFTTHSRRREWVRAAGELGRVLQGEPPGRGGTPVGQEQGVWGLGGQRDGGAGGHQVWESHSGGIGGVGVGRERGDAEMDVETGAGTEFVEGLQCGAWRSAGRTGAGEGVWAEVWGSGARLGILVCAGVRKRDLNGWVM